MRPNNRPLIIGITGNIGSGKTTVCEIISKQYPVYYADIIAHQVLNEPEVKDKLVDRWGQHIIDNSNISRKAVAQKVFGNPEELMFLNSVTHPKVLKEMQYITDKSNECFLFFEVPLLFEAKLQSCFDHIVLIQTSYEIRLKRTSNRDNQIIEDTKLRDKTQISADELSALSDTIINNDGSLLELSLSVKAFLETLPQLKKREINHFYNLI